MIVSGTKDMSKACHIWFAVVHMDKIMLKKTLLLVGKTTLQKWIYVSVTWWDPSCERGIIHSKAIVGMEV